MRRATRSLAKAKAAESPMEPTAVDLKIKRNHGRTVALDATNEHLQASKKAPIPDLSQRIYELTKENGRLRLEIRYHQQMQEAMRALQEDAKFVVGTMENSIVEFCKVQKEVDDDWYRSLGVDKE